MSSWILVIRVQERGTKREKNELATFATREDALSAAQKLERDYAVGQENDILVVDSGAERVSLFRQDFRRTYIYETGLEVGADDW